MLLTEYQRKEFENLSKPLIKFIVDNFDPHTIIIVECDGSQIKTGEYGFHTAEFIN
jgi:hypothetical protein